MAVERLDTETRQIQIKKAVLDIISTEGIGNLSIRNLASKVGVTEGALFRHFSSKREIILSIIEDVKKELISNLEKIATSKDINAEDKLFNFLCYHIMYLLENKGITMILFSEATHLNDPELKKGIQEIYFSQKEYISKIIEQGMKENIFNKSLDIEDIATLYMGIPVVLNMEMILKTNFVRKQEFCLKMINLLKKVLKP